MPIIDQETNTPAVNTNRRFRRDVAGLLETMESSYEQGLSGVFKHPKLAPQEVCDALGTDCAELFSFLNECKQLVEQYTNKTLTPVSTYGNVTLNGDGTVTVNSVV